MTDRKKSNEKFCITRKPKILFLVLLWFLPQLLHGQSDGKFSFQLEDKPLKEVLAEVSKVSGYKFAYSESEIPVESIVSFRVRNASIEEVVLKLSRSLGLNAEFLSTNIILTSDTRGKPITVKGYIYDAETKLPIQWVNISSTDKQHGTLSDSAGYFSIILKPGQQELSFSYIGYHTFRSRTDSDTLLNIYLKEEIREFEEVVVVAFGNEKRDLIGGSVTVLNPSQFRHVNTSSVNSSLQTIAPGLQVRNNAGTPGSAISVSIRGVSSITAGNAPLYVIDGIPMIRGDYSQLDFSGQTIDAITDISINDIESITILKDAAASSLYGATASNGVILLTTKQGIASGNEIMVDSYYGIQQTTNKLSLLNAAQWMQLANENAEASGEEPVYSPGEITNNPYNTDWLGEVFRPAPTYNFHMSFRGGNERSKYYLSGNYFNQDGIVIGSSYDRYSFRVNYQYKLNNRLSFEAGNGFSYTRNNRLEGDQSLNGPLPVAISMPPVFPVLNPDGSYNNEGPYANPVSIANEEKNLATSFRNLFNFAVNLQITDRLQARSQTGIDFYNLGEQTFAPKTTRQGAKYNGLGIEATNNTFLLYHTTFLRYDIRFTDHHLSFMGGFSTERYRSHGTFLRAQNFPGTSFEFLQNAATPIIASSNELDARTNSLFGSVKYNYLDRYILNGNIRRDGSSKFGTNNRFGIFPSVSMLWYLSNENFWRENDVITRARVRASFGRTGNDQITDFISLDLFAAGSNYNGEAGIAPFQISNPDLKWETTNQLNLGFETEWAGRVLLSADYYMKRTSDLLLENPIPASTGYTYFVSNIGEIQNQGVEVELSANILKGTIRWDASASLTANQNKVLQLYQDQPVRNIGRASSSIEVGYPVSYFYGFVSQGVDPETGLLIYEDVVEDGVINDQDRTFIGSPFPTLFGGVLNQFSWRGFDLSLLVYYSYGNKIFNSTRLYTETISLGNQTTAVLDRWKSEGDMTDVPRASSYNERISSRFVEDGSFLRLKSLKLGYTFPKAVSGRLKLNQLQCYIAGKNLITLTGYSGMDPEVNYNTENNIVFGTDFFTCPQPMSILFGVCAKF